MKNFDNKGYLDRINHVGVDVFIESHDSFFAYSKYGNSVVEIPLDNSINQDTRDMIYDMASGDWVCVIAWRFIHPLLADILLKLPNGSVKATTFEVGCHRSVVVLVHKNSYDLFEKFTLNIQSSSLVNQPYKKQ